MQSFLWYFNAGGLLMWPLLLCSWFALALIVDRIRKLRSSMLIDGPAIDEIRKMLEAGDRQRAMEKYHASPVVLPRVIGLGLAEYRPEIEDVAITLERSARRHLPVLGNNVALIGAVGRVAVLLGLLGTMFGMIAGFDALEKPGASKSQLASAMRMALITTATGILIAIPCVMSAAYFRNKLRRCEALFVEILDAVAKSARAGSGYSPRIEELPISQPAADEQFVLPSILSGKA